MGLVLIKSQGSKIEIYFDVQFLGDRQKSQKNPKRFERTFHFTPRDCRHYLGAYLVDNKGDFVNLFTILHCRYLLHM